jgi:hypothetical protein
MKFPSTAIAIAPGTGLLWFVQANASKELGQILYK